MNKDYEFGVFTSRIRVKKMFYLNIVANVTVSILYDFNFIAIRAIYWSVRGWTFAFFF